MRKWSRIITALLVVSLVALVGYVFYLDYKRFGFEAAMITPLVMLAAFAYGYSQ